MTRNLPEWAYLVDETGRYWYHLENGTRQPVSGEKGSRPPGKSLFAIATNDLVSIPQWVSSKDPDIISEVVEAEISRLGFPRNGGPGKTSDWKPVELNGTRTLVQSVSTPWALEELAKAPVPGDFTGFFPQYALYPPPPGAAVLWREGQVWVAGYSRGSRWIHVQTLGGDEMRPLLAGEINLTLIELSAKGLIEGASRIVVWAPYDAELYQSLEEETGLPVSFEARPAPAPSAAPAWSFEPHEISRARLAKKRRQRVFSLGFAVVLVLALLASAAAFHLMHLKRSNATLEAKIEANRPAANVISETKDRWQTLEPAIDPKRSPVELFYLVSSLLPEKGLRLTMFEVRDDKIIEVRAEGATMANAIQIKGAFEKDESLADYSWVVPPPRPKDDLTEIYATGTYRFSTDETE
ncbi:MAG: hypothetical protein KDN18_23815 [Verrucomicrobiae bacterium]|nr:hypothetical protein [Verrucomicrobiae bacterium]